MINKKKLIIAIDGPAASGKSTTARLVAQKLGYLYIDSGAMYRALTSEVLRKGIAVENEKTVCALARQIDIQLVPSETGLRTYLDGTDISEAIRLPEVTRVISRVSAYREVREIMKIKQQKMAANGAVVMDGRDIGTVVLPAADIKIFMEASVDKRTDRRVKELNKKGLSVDRKNIKAEILQRDQIDSTREIAPLKPAKDAHIIDTSDLTIDQQVEKVLEIVAKIISF